MTQPADSAVSLPVASLKAILQSADDTALSGFLHGYVLGSAADMFISTMTEPHQRAEFLVAIAKTYPDDWKEAVDLLQNG